MTDEKKQLVTKSDLKNQYDFTEKMIKELLGKPIEKTNPKYKCAAPMKLWKKEEIEAVMQTEKYKEMKETADRRRASAKRAAETKKEKTLSEIEEKINNIHVTKIDEERLREVTLRDKEDWYEYNYLCSYARERKTAYGADEDTIRRWMVNYIRHNLTDYDYDLESLKNKVGKDKAYELYKESVLNKIAETYPYLADECENQMYRYEEEWSLRNMWF